MAAAPSLPAARPHPSPGHRGRPAARRRHGALLLRRRAVVRFARLRRRLLENTEPAGDRLQHVHARDVRHPVRIVRGVEAAAPRRADRLSDSDQRTADQAAGRTGAAADRDRRLAADRLCHRRRDDGAVVHARVVVVREGRRAAEGGGGRRRSNLRQAAAVLSVHAAGVAAPFRVGDDAGGDRCRRRLVLHCRHRRHADARRAPRLSGHRGMARAIGRLRRGAAGARGADVSRSVRAAVRRPHHFFGRHLHRGARHAHRRARRLGGVGAWRGDRVRERCFVAEAAMARRRDRTCGAVLRRRRRARLVRHELHRQAERARPRAAVHHAQHRDDTRRVRAQSHRAASVSGGDDRRGRRRPQQPGHDSKHPPVGLARAAGHAAAAAGDPHVLRFPRHRHRSLRD